jgi:hypothetical protein
VSSTPPGPVVLYDGVAVSAIATFDSCSSGTGGGSSVLHRSRARSARGRSHATECIWRGSHLDRIARIAGLSARTRVRSLGRGAEHHDRIGRSVAAGGRAARDSPLLARRRLRSRGACTIPDLRPARQLPASSADGRGPVPRLMDDPAARPVRDDIARRHLQREIRWPGVSRALPAARRDLGGAAAPSRHQAGHGAPLPGGSGAGHGADARAEVRPTRR